MNLIKINLLPYRELREAADKKRFNIIMAVGGFAGVAAAGLIYTFLSQAVEKQEERNATLEQGVNTLKEQAKAIDSLEQRKYNFLERKSKVEELDHKRFEGARIVDSLNQIVPQGAYLMNLKGADGQGNQAGKDYILEGKAVADTKIASLMAGLPSTGIFDIPELVEIKKEEDGQKFTLKSVLVKQIPPVRPKPAAAPAAASTPAEQSENK